MRTVTCKNRGGLGTLISLLFVSLAFPAVAGAQEQMKVVGHLALPGIHVNGMFVQHRDGKDYLYLHRPVKQAFAVVDVSKPQKPVLVERATMAEASHAQVVDTTNPSLAISVTAENAQGTSTAPVQAVSLPTETLKLLDLSDPKHPKVIKSFSGVTSFLPDDTRKLIYIQNADGLTNIHHPQVQPMPLSTSEDALTQQPNCQ